MAAWLNDWLRDIILIILVATFVDLLIPNNSLERYVKVVVSLIVLLTILSPIITFLKEDIGVNQVLEQAIGKNDQSQSLNLILTKGEKLSSENGRQSTILTEQQVGKLIKDKLGNLQPAWVQKVTVTIIEEENQPSIGHVQVVLTLDQTKLEDNASTIQQDTTVDRVTPVTVQVKLEETSQKSDQVNNEEKKRSPTQKKIEKQVIQQIVDQWELVENRIQVEWR